MGLGDFISAMESGRIGEYFGGKRPGQQRIDNFVDNELPAMYKEIQGNTDERKIPELSMKFFAAALRAGIPPANVEKLSEMIIKPTLEGIKQNQLAGIMRDYGPQTTPITPMVAPQGQGQPLGLETAFAPQTTPARNPMADPEGAFRMAQAFGAKPEHLENIFKTPAEIANKEASTLKTAQSVEQQQRLQGIKLPGSAGAAGITAGMLTGEHAGGLSSYLTGMNPQREDPLADVKERRIEAQIDRLNRPPAERAPPRGSTEMQDFIAAGGNPQDQAAFMDYLDRRRGRASETVTTVPPPSGLNLEVTLAAIAKDAYKQGKTKPEEIQDIARQRGIELEGTPTIDPGGYFGTPKLTGAFTPKTATPRVVTKGKPGATPPTGQPPAQGAPPASNIPPNGTKGKSNSGKPMTVVNGQWRYD